LDEIRLHGENAELREEVVALARQYGIVTPYTAYLIVEDESKRNVASANQSLSRLSQDKDAALEANLMWDSFKKERSGGGAVANAQSQNFFKYADQAHVAISAGNSAALSSVAVAKRAPNSGVTRLGQYAQQTRFVNGRAFFQNGSQWVDGNVQALTKRAQLKFNSKEYFDFLSSHPESAPWLALGTNVLLAVGDTAYEISD
jgi:Ca-activated chloride channel family protein